ncbi:hypothetical protein BKG75_16205 [Mycobacteroides chelonae]|nr:hypothetical protein DYE20_04585 [[Mycobacterium] chelonae subsp. gwanakae]OHU16499.1 hypothetical protein BKG75_16205 [Mycobacteroides chelonae]
MCVFLDCADIEVEGVSEDLGGDSGGEAVPCGGLEFGQGDVVSVESAAQYLDVDMFSWLTAREQPSARSAIDFGSVRDREVSYGSGQAKAMIAHDEGYLAASDDDLGAFKANNSGCRYAVDRDK